MCFLTLCAQDLWLGTRPCCLECSQLCCQDPVFTHLSRHSPLTLPHIACWLVSLFRSHTTPPHSQDPLCPFTTPLKHLAPLSVPLPTSFSSPIYTSLLTPPSFLLTYPSLLIFPYPSHLASFSLSNPVPPSCHHLFSSVSSPTLIPPDPLFTCTFFVCLPILPLIHSGICQVKIVDIHCFRPCGKA